MSQSTQLNGRFPNELCFQFGLRRSNAEYFWEKTTDSLKVKVKLPAEGHQIYRRVI